MVKVEVSLCTSEYKELDIPSPQVTNRTINSMSMADKSGTIMETLPYDQYRVRMDGSRRVSLRNRKFLKPINPYSPTRVRPAPDV